MKAVLISIQPYYAFLIIARAMGWKVEQEKTVEVRKNFPQAGDWDKKAFIYCSRDRRSFNRIPKEYQQLMAPLLGKVLGEFVCDKIDEFHEWQLKPYGKFRDFEEEELQEFFRKSCFSYKEVCDYRRNMEYYQPLFVWHISNLKIYERPKELSEFTTPFCPYEVTKSKVGARLCKHFTFKDTLGGVCDYGKRIARPPQSWCYLKELQ